jgi:hypothetical protein
MYCYSRYVVHVYNKITKAIVHFFDQGNLNHIVTGDVSISEASRISSNNGEEEWLCRRVSSTLIWSEPGTEERRRNVQI